jgi:hypothetical protein
LDKIRHAKRKSPLHICIIKRKQGSNNFRKAKLKAMEDSKMLCAVEKLLTKFFYKDNFLFFQILIENNNGIEVYAEYRDYSEYRAEYQKLQKQLTTEGKIKVMQKNLSVMAKVA